MRCREVQQRAQDLMDERRDVTADPIILAHLQSCSACKAEIQALAALSRLAAAHQRSSQDRASVVRARVMDELRERRPARLVRRHPWSTRVVVAVPAAAAAVFIVFLLGVVVGRGSIGGGPGSDLASVKLQVPQAADGGLLATGPAIAATPSAPITLAGGDEAGQPLTAEPLPSVEPVETVAPHQPGVSVSQPRRAAGQRAAPRKPIVPRGGSVRPPGSEPPPRTVDTPTLPERPRTSEDTVTVRSYEVEIEGLQLPGDLLFGVEPDGKGSNKATIIMVVPGQEL